MSILTKNEIIRAVNHGEIEIEPFDVANVQPNSYDVHLGDKMMIVAPNCFINGLAVYDLKLEPKFQSIEMGKYGEFCLMANQLYLGVTKERTFTPKHVPYIDGKSSIGRCGVSIHVTAGRGDVGFNGYWTLEIICAMNTILYAGQPIGQITFHEVSGEVESYNGNYQKQMAEPVPSKIYKKL